MEMVTTTNYLELAEKQKILREMYNLHIEIFLYNTGGITGIYWQADVRDIITGKQIDTSSDLYIPQSYEAILRHKINASIEYLKKQNDTSY